MSQPNFSYERGLWRRGYKFVVGIDEVGRGAWAGPVVVAAAIFPPPNLGITQKTRSCLSRYIQIDGLNDSKLLKPRFREQLAKEIQKKALAWDVTEVGVGVVNRIGIGKATEKAMRKCIRDIMKKLTPITHPRLTTHNSPPSLFILVDYFYIPYLRGLGLKNQKAIKNGDQKSFSIAAASILAKVHRDKIMRSLARKPRYKVYGWGRNKGYGTKSHQKAILRYGLTRFHRRQFVESWKKKSS